MSGADFKPLAKLFAQAEKAEGKDAAVPWALRMGIDVYDEMHNLPWSFGDVFAPPSSMGEESDEACRAYWRGHAEAFAKADTFPIGDAYQFLDNGAVKAFAFCQTPRFVAELLCEHAIGWGEQPGATAEFGADVVRVLDPACGTGHILATAMLFLFVRQIGADTPDAIAKSLVSRIVGADINPVAAALCRWRLASLAIALSGGLVQGDRPEDFVPTVLVADALEKTPDTALRSPSLPAEDRAALQKLVGGFHVIVANPPYIVESDTKRRDYDRAHYVSAYMRYGLGVVFTERMFDLGVPGAFIAQITSNAFMKREYGATLVAKVLPRFDLTHVLNTSGCYIPGHGTPTVILFARNRPPRGEQLLTVDTKQGETEKPLAPWDKAVLAVQAKRGEPSTPEDAAQGLAWQSVVKAYRLHERKVRECAAARRLEAWAKAYRQQFGHAPGWAPANEEVAVANAG